MACRLTSELLLISAAMISASSALAAAATVESAWSPTQEERAAPKLSCEHPRTKVVPSRFASLRLGGRLRRPTQCTTVL